MYELSRAQVGQVSLQASGSRLRNLLPRAMHVHARPLPLGCRFKTQALVLPHNVLQGTLCGWLMEVVGGTQDCRHQRPRVWPRCSQMRGRPGLEFLGPRLMELGSHSRVHPLTQYRPFVSPNTTGGLRAGLNPVLGSWQPWLFCRPGGGLTCLL